MKRSTWLHLRIPFSFYLLPIFCFAVSQTAHPRLMVTLLIAIILHLLAYPASQGFNSYYDRDQGSIGGLERPPPVSRELLVVALAFDVVALLLALLVGWGFTGLLLACGLASKAYSHPAIRLKRRPWLGWLVVALFQGGVTYAMVALGAAGAPLRALWSRQVLVPAVLASLLVGGAYPMTQIFQHAEDAGRGDLTLSLHLGVRGTFRFCRAMLVVCLLGFFAYFSTLGRAGHFLVLAAFLMAPGLYVERWFARVKRDERQADFRSAMALNRISAISLISGFAVLTALAR
jgi:1,4-dihydroxy-2-naphthoate octaprenyltransferase